MPVLESPEVKIDEKVSGLTLFSQQERVPSEEYQTDVGLNFYTGMNVISTAVQLYQVPQNGNPETSLRMIINLGEAWDHKDAFVRDMKETHNVHVAIAVNPFDTRKSTLSVSGIKDIETLAGVFRSTQFVSQHDGADIYRQMINPALLGEVLDAAHVKMVEFNAREVDFTKSYPTYGWIR